MDQLGYIVRSDAGLDGPVWVKNLAFEGNKPVYTFTYFVETAMRFDIDTAERILEDMKNAKIEEAKKND